MDKRGDDRRNRCSEPGAGVWHEYENRRKAVAQWTRFMAGV